MYLIISQGQAGSRQMSGSWEFIWLHKYYINRSSRCRTHRPNRKTLHQKYCPGKMVLGICTSFTTIFPHPKKLDLASLQSFPTALGKSSKETVSSFILSPQIQLLLGPHAARPILSMGLIVCLLLELRLCWGPIQAAYPASAPRRLWFFN